MKYEKEKLLRIGKPGELCALCGLPLTDADRHPSTLRANDAPPEDAPSAENGDERPEVIRSDYHVECWQKLSASDYVSFWMAKRPKPPEQSERKLSKDERNALLIGLFEALMASDDPADEPMRFIVSHLLMKYKALTPAGSRVDQEGRRWIDFEAPKSDERYEIANIALSDQQAAETLARVHDYLAQAALRPAPPEPEQASEEPASEDEANDSKQ